MSKAKGISFFNNDSDHRAGGSKILEECKVIGAIVGDGIFVFNGKVCWEIGLCLAAGIGLGSWIGSNWAVKKGERWIRVMLTICVVAMVIKLIV